MADQYEHSGTQSGDTPTVLTFPSPWPFWVQVINDNAIGGEDLLAACPNVNGGENATIKPGEVKNFINARGIISRVSVVCASGQSADYRVQTNGVRDELEAP